MPDPKVEIVGIRELRLGEALTMSYPGQPVLGTKQVVPMFLETMDPKTGEKVELKLALSMEQLAELQARAAKASTGTEYIGRLQFFGPLRVGDSGLSTNIYKPLNFLLFRRRRRVDPYSPTCMPAMPRTGGSQVRGVHGWVEPNLL